MADENEQEQTGHFFGGPATSAASILTTLAPMVMDLGNLVRNALQHPASSTAATQYISSQLFGNKTRENEQEAKNAITNFRTLLDYSEKKYKEAKNYTAENKKAIEDLRTMVNIQEESIQKAKTLATTFKTVGALVQVTGLAMAAVNEKMDIAAVKSGGNITTSLLPGSGKGSEFDARRALSFDVQKWLFDVQSNYGNDMKEVTGQVYSKYGSVIASKLGLKMDDPEFKSALENIGGMVYGRESQSLIEPLLNTSDLKGSEILGIMGNVSNLAKEGEFGNMDPGSMQNLFARVFVKNKEFLNRGGVGDASATAQMVSLIGKSNATLEQQALLHNFISEGLSSPQNALKMRGLAGYGTEDYANDPLKVLQKVGNLLEKYTSNEMTDADRMVLQAITGADLKNANEMSIMIKRIIEGSKDATPELEKISESFKNLKDINLSDALKKTEAAVKETAAARTPWDFIQGNLSKFGYSVSETMGPAAGYIGGGLGMGMSLLGAMYMLRKGKMLPAMLMMEGGDKLGNLLSGTTTDGVGDSDSGMGSPILELAAYKYLFGKGRTAGKAGGAFSNFFKNAHLITNGKPLSPSRWGVGAGQKIDKVGRFLNKGWGKVGGRALGVVGAGLGAYSMYDKMSNDKYDSNWEIADDTGDIIAGLATFGGPVGMTVAAGWYGGKALVEGYKYGSSLWNGGYYIEGQKAIDANAKYKGMRKWNKGKGASEIDYMAVDLMHGVKNASYYSLLEDVTKNYEYNHEVGAWFHTESGNKVDSATSNYLAWASQRRSDVLRTKKEMEKAKNSDESSGKDVAKALVEIQITNPSGENIGGTMVAANSEAVNQAIIHISSQSVFGTVV